MWLLEHNRTLTSDSVIRFLDANEQMVAKEDEASDDDAEYNIHRVV